MGTGTPSGQGRRRFLAGATGAAAAAVAIAGAAAASPPAVPRAPRNGALARSIGRAVALKAGGADAAQTPPLAVRALHRMGFGPMRRRKTAAGAAPPDRVFGAGFEPDGKAGEDDIGYFMSLGRDDDARLAAWVEEQLDPALPDPGLQSRMAAQAAAFATLSQPLATLWSQRECQGFSDYIRPYREAECAAFVRATYSRRQLFELVVDFWHDHFNVYAGLDSDTYVSFGDWDRTVVRQHAFGNFHAMLLASARHPAMLRYLDNYENSVSGINENYARELFELHTFGAEHYRGLQSNTDVAWLAAPAAPGELPSATTDPADPPFNPYAAIGDVELNAYGIQNRTIAAYYVDEDVYTAASGLTGWRFEDRNTATSCGTGAFLTDEQDHAAANAKVLLSRGFQTLPSGLSADLEGRLILKMAAWHPATAVHVARRLCTRLIADEPPESVVQAAARTFYANRTRGDQIARTLRTILNSPEFKDPALWGSKTKRPFEYVVSALRAAGGDYTFHADDNATGDFLRTFNRAGQRLFWWRTPDGYPDRRGHWEGSTSLVQGWRAVDWLLNHEYDTPARMMRVLDITLENLPSGGTPRQLAAFWCEWILGHTPAGGWVGAPGTLVDSAPTAVGRAALRFMTQEFLEGGLPVPEEDRPLHSPDFPITRAQLSSDDWPAYWHRRLLAMVAVILWSPDFLLR
jgi:uncharacterized protein (DUF1800 family)